MWVYDGISCCQPEDSRWGAAPPAYVSACQWGPARLRVCAVRVRVTRCGTRTTRHSLSARFCQCGKHVPWPPNLKAANLNLRPEPHGASLPVRSPGGRRRDARLRSALRVPLRPGGALRELVRAARASNWHRIMIAGGARRDIRLGVVAVPASHGELLAGPDRAPAGPPE